MKLTVSSTALSARLSALSKVINSKNSITILGDFLFEVTEGKLRLTASDGENTIKTTIELADSDGDFAFAVGNHDLLEAVRGYSEQPITIEVDQATNIATVNYQNGKFSLPVDNAADYPETVAIAESATVVNLPCSLLAENIARSLFAVAQDELRPVMNGIYFDLTSESLNIVASDSQKLVRNIVRTVKSDTPAAFILPQKPAALLRALLGKGEGEASIAFDGRNAEIDYEDGVLTCRLIEGRFPNYNSVIPQSSPNKGVVDRVSLLSALRHVTPFASSASCLVKFHLEPGLLRLDAQDFDFSKTATEQLACEYTGIPMNIGLKGTGIIDILSNIEADEVELQLTDSSRAALVVPSVQPDNQEVAMLMMPMLLNDF